MFEKTGEFCFSANALFGSTWEKATSNGKEKHAIEERSGTPAYIVKRAKVVDQTKKGRAATLEREEQRGEQQQKQAAAKARREHPQKPAKGKHPSEAQQAGMATDPAAMQDPGYIERMNEKTNKH